MDDVRHFLPLTPHQFQILLGLAGADRHGYGIILDVAERTGGAMRLGTGTLYTALAGMVDSGWVADSKRRLTARDDSRRRYYTLTALGRRVLEAETTRLDSLVRQARRQGIQPATTARPAWSRTK